MLKALLQWGYLHRRPLRDVRIFLLVKMKGPPLQVYRMARKAPKEIKNRGLTFIDLFVLLKAVFFGEFAGLAGFFEAAHFSLFFELLTHRYLFSLLG